MDRKKKQQKSSYWTRIAMTVLTVVLIVLFFGIMSLVSRIQGTARVVNYAGLVRGGTQRIIKLEIAGKPQDELIQNITDIIEGLRNGSDTLDLVRLDDTAFQTKMTELADYFTGLKSEIRLVRQYGYRRTDILTKSETFFSICDEATGLAEQYSQQAASALNTLESVVILDIIGLVCLIGWELIKALRFAAMNRVLQSKVYLDEATGLPNKNKCEELLDGDAPAEDAPAVAVCVFDLNNLRTINNNLGHDRGDEYIRSFGQQLRLAVPQEHFVGRDGGDEFLALLYGLDHAGVEDVLQQLRTQTAAYSAQHPEMPLSYAAGYALSTDFEGSSLRELFRHADKNMYIDKNRAKLEEAAAQKALNLQLLASVQEQGYHFSDCLYCDALLDQYRTLRARDGFFLAEDGSYTGAVEQIAKELCDPQDRFSLWNPLQPVRLQKALSADHPQQVLTYHKGEGADTQRGRITVLFCDAAPDGSLHHFLLGFENFLTGQETADEKQRLSRYYEQLRQSIQDNGSYVDALLDTAQAVYTIDLTHDRMESALSHFAPTEFNIQLDLFGSYNAYCRARSAYITEDTMENFRIVDSTQKLLERFAGGSKQVVVEYCERGIDGQRIWLQKTVLMSRDTLFDSETGCEREVVHGIVLFKNTSAFHEKEQQEKERLQTAFEEADSASKAKTEFLNRMSHDVRTPINGIMGMLDIIRKNRNDTARVDDCLNKIGLSAGYLLALVSDVLDMSKLESGKAELEQVSFDVEELMQEVAALMNAQLTETGLHHGRHRGTMRHTALIGSPLHLRQIMLNLFSNAVKYNKPNGQIDTYAEELSDDGTTTWYEFRITDTGVGMSREFVENELFKPFTQEKSGARTHYRGTGLGMSIVKDLVEKMGGTIDVESELGQGTTFRFRLPFQIDKSAPALPSPAPGSSSDGAELTGFRLLLAEDNEINMEIAEFYLTERGAAVDKAWDGQQAVDAFAAAPIGHYDAILLDVMMPVLDGPGAARKIRAMDRSDAATIPILAMTAQTSSDSAQICLQAGMNDHLCKPLDPDALLQALLRHLHKTPQ